MNGVVDKYNGNHGDYNVKWDHRDYAYSLWQESDVEWGVHLFESIGIEVSKEFGEHGFFSGKVVDVTREQGEIFYRIVYEDGDFEDMDLSELKEGQKWHQKISKKKSAKQRPTVTPKKEKEEEVVEKKDHLGNGDSSGRRRRNRGKVSYVEVDEDSMDLDSDEEEIRQTRKRLKQTKPPPKKEKRKVDDDEFENDIEEESDTDLIVDDDYEEKKVKPRTSSKKSQSKKKNTPTMKTIKQSETRKSDANENKNAVDEEFEERLRKERKRVKPNNNPQKLPAAGSYVDPVGVDPTHGIVERIVSDQVRKVGGLLQKVQARNRPSPEDFKTELSYPIRLQTACSGTDAPSIALGLIKESLSRLCSKSDGNEKHKFDYEHMMSCEIEPFKQAYIARNFPGVPLFPDITKLSTINEDGEGEKVVDVYGRPQFIPEGDLFVAGTSCKDFSMLKTTRRKDIQDKGQSGETFLAAVEFLDLYQPPFAIFENVDGAPWDKMQEYIQGRINLAERNNNRAITSTKRKNSEFS